MRKLKRFRLKPFNFYRWTETLNDFLRHKLVGEYCTKILLRISFWWSHLAFLMTARESLPFPFFWYMYKACRNVKGKIGLLTWPMPWGLVLFFHFFQYGLLMASRGKPEERKTWSCSFKTHAWTQPCLRLHNQNLCLKMRVANLGSMNLQKIYYLFSSFADWKFSCIFFLNSTMNLCNGVTQTILYAQKCVISVSQNSCLPFQFQVRWQINHMML